MLRACVTAPSHDDFVPNLPGTFIVNSEENRLLDTRYPFVNRHPPWFELACDRVPFSAAIGVEQEPEHPPRSIEVGPECLDLACEVSGE